MEKKFPKTSNDLAVLGFYYRAIIFLIAFSLVGAVLVLRCHFADDKPSKGLLRFATFVLRNMEKNKCSKNINKGSEP